MTPLGAADTAFSPMLPQAWAHEVQAVLAPNEKLLAWLEPDLDASLFFVSGIMLLTPERLV